MIKVKSEKELEKMRKAGKVVGDTLRMIEQYVKPGISTLELDTIIEEFIRSQNATPSFKGLYGFPNAACISIDEQVVHGFPSVRKLKEGEIVSIDIGACVEGYHGDAARTFPVGKISAEKQQLIDVTRECFFKGIANARAGRRLGDVSHAIQAHAEAHNYGVVRVMTGHGIGRHVHEDPSVYNYGAANTGIVLKAGYCIAVEPMINMGTYKVDLNGWSCLTSDRKPSAHYENTIIITNSEPEITTL